MSNHTAVVRTALIAGIVVASATGIYLWWNSCRKREDEPKDESNFTDTTIPRQVDLSAPSASADKIRILSQNTITIAYSSVTGTCARFAAQLHQQLIELRESKLSGNCTEGRDTTAIQLGSMEEWDWWDELLNSEETQEEDGNSPVVIFLLPTHTEGSWPVPAEPLKQALQDLQNDWRIEKNPLRGRLQVAVFGMGSSAYDKATMGRPAKQAWQSLKKLGAKTLGKVVVGDDAVGTEALKAYEKWTQQVIPTLEAMFVLSCDKTSNGSCCQIEPRSNGLEDPDEHPYYDMDEEEEEREPQVMDMEDIGDSLLKAATEQASDEVREMVTPSQAEALKKEGYKLIGSHSAVKLCRWTKHQLRGRGGCYKHTFYGITSYQCMEATPSLACANKCVFCWRHHKNPVGKEWRWKTDDPKMIVDEAVKTHVKMIKEAKGIPGVRPDRWQEALTIRHCALSLVGEPIMYPRIDELLGDLHLRKISTFLVTNGQHPRAIANIRPITQLYVSVDAPTPESLIAIDRPLFQDAWERLRQSLSMLKEKGQRTVARLTVVKGWNSDEIEGYAKLVALGHVSLVEVKGVTFCGKSDASNLNMSNTPWHHEVVELVRNLKLELDKLRVADQSLPEYDLACEHKHSVSVLLARVDQFALDDIVTGKRKWRTWIDYDKFHELAIRNEEDPAFTFSVQDYLADTPPWALFGAEQEGFDPTDSRHRKQKKHPKYTQFDDQGVPTHDHNNKELSPEERTELAHQMQEKRRQIGCGSTITELRGGEKQIQDASLMFRGMVIAK